MDRLRLDYQRNMRPFPMAGALLLAAGIALSTWAGVHYYRVTASTAEWESRLGRYEQGGATGNAVLRDARSSAKDVKQANEVLRQLTLPWESLFAAVESSAGPDVTLLSMEPDSGKSVVNIGCEAKSITAMLEYVGRLQARREFSGVYLINHQVQEREPERPVRFSLVAYWRTAS